MRTYMAKAQEIDRKWYILDAANKPLGRVATEAARMLRGNIRYRFVIDMKATCW